MKVTIKIFNKEKTLRIHDMATVITAIKSSAVSMTARLSSTDFKRDNGTVRASTITEALELLEVQDKRSQRREPTQSIEVQTTVAEVVPFIRALKAKGQKHYADQLKDCLPAFVCGEYWDLTKGIGMEQPMTHNGTMVMDVDGITLEHGKALREVIENSPLWRCVAFCFVSPSGGLKFGVRTSYGEKGADAELYKFIYRNLYADIQKITGLTDELDKRTCNFNRLTYLSHDTEAYYNEWAQVMAIPSSWYDGYAEEERKRKVDEQRRRDVMKVGQWNEQKAKRWLDKRIPQIINGMCNGNRHDQYHRLCQTVYRAGFGVTEATAYLDMCKAMGQWTESCSTRAKAQDSWKSFKGIVDEWFFDRTVDEVVMLSSNNLKSKLAEWGLKREAA